MTVRLLSISQVLDKIPVSRQAIYVWMSKGEFPVQRRISTNRVAWMEDEVNAWIEERSVKAEKS